MTKGEQIRDFIQVELVVKHLLIAISRSDLVSGNPLVVNIGSGFGQSLKDFAFKEWVNLKAKGKLLPGKLEGRNYEIKQMVANIESLNLRK